MVEDPSLLIPILAAENPGLPVNPHCKSADLATNNILSFLSELSKTHPSYLIVFPPSHISVAMNCFALRCHPQEDYYSV